MTRSPSLRTIRKQSFASLNRYFSDPSYAAQCQAIDARNHAESMAMMDRNILKPSPVDPAFIKLERRKRERAEIEHQEDIENARI